MENCKFCVSFTIIFKDKKLKFSFVKLEFIVKKNQIRLFYTCITMIRPLLESDIHCLLPHWPEEEESSSGLSISSLYRIAINAIGEANLSKIALKVIIHLLGILFTIFAISRQDKINTCILIFFFAIQGTCTCVHVNVNMMFFKYVIWNVTSL